MAIVMALVTYGLDISVSGNGTTDPAPGSYTYAEGTTVPITAYPAEGYKLDRWEMDGTYAGASSTLNVTMNAQHAVVAYFVIQTFTITIRTTEGGTTSPIPGSYGPYDYGTVVTVTAVPAAGFNFASWLLDGTIYTANPIGVTITKDLTLTADFTEIPKATLQGVVADSETGELISGVSVALDGNATSSGVDGRYSLTVYVGAYTLTVSKTGYNTWTGSVNLPTSGTYTQDVRLTKTPITPPAESIVQGTVTDAETNLPVADAQITVNGYLTTSDANGNYVLTVTPATYTLTVTKEGYETWSQTLDTATPGTYILNISLTKTTVAPPAIEPKWILLGIAIIGLAVFFIAKPKI